MGGRGWWWRRLRSALRAVRAVGEGSEVAGKGVNVSSKKEEEAFALAAELNGQI